MKNIIAENKSSVYGLNNRVDIAEDWESKLAHWATGRNDKKDKKNSLLHIYRAYCLESIVLSYL